MGDEKIIVFGAGRTGEKFLYDHFNDTRIDCVWDNKQAGEILGYPIKEPTAGKNSFIIVASMFYLEIRKQLMQMGYREFVDFIPWQIFRKKMAIAYGNCNMDAVRMYLERHKKFAMEYGFYPFPAICDLWNLELEYGDILQHCNLFLHQSVRKENVYGEAYSSENMLMLLPKECDVISCPNLYGMPKYLFPQIDMGVKWPMGQLNPFFPDRNIIGWIKDGKSLEWIKACIFEGCGLYKKSEITDIWEKFFHRLNIRERMWDIKVSDYILKHQKEKRIFCDINHITSEAAHEIGDRLLKYMGYEEQNISELPILDALETIIYGDVRNALGLTFEMNVVRKWNSANNLHTYEMDIGEYISQLYQFTLFWVNRK